MKTTRREFMKVAALTGVGYWAMAGNASRAQPLANGRMGLAAFGVGGHGTGDLDAGAQHCDVIAIVDADRPRLAAAQERFPRARAFTDYRDAFDAVADSFDVITVSTPDHTHAPIALMGVRAGKHAFVQKPITRTIYEARLLGEEARKAGVVTQMGNQGAGSNRLRNGAAQIKAGVIGDLEIVYTWSNRPVWAQAPGRAMCMERFAARTRETQPQRADALIAAQQAEVERHLAGVDWDNWIGPSPMRPFWPGIYMPFQWRGWWDFGTGALGDMACHTMNLPYVACELKFPTSVQARSSGHDFDSFPGRSEIKYEFPATDWRKAIEFWWFDGGVRPPAEVFARFGITDQPGSGALIIGEKGVMFAPGDYGGDWRLIGNNGEPLEAIPENELDFVRNRDGNTGEFYRSVRENTPEQCASNFPDSAGPFTETILLGNLAIWAAPNGPATGAADAGGGMGDWGEKVEWNARDLVVTNVASLRTPGVAELVKPVYREGHILDEVASVTPPQHRRRRIFRIGTFRNLR